MTHTTDAAPTGAALSAHPDDPDIRILRRVTALKDFPLAPPTYGPVRFVTVVDTETTGTDPLHDEIIDIAVVTLEFDAAGEIVGILSSGQALRDPHTPIPSYISKLTGITDDDVRGRVTDLDRLEHRLSKADVLIAHNAQFDAAFIENLMPGIAGAAWACSANDFDWLEAGLDGRKLGQPQRFVHSRAVGAHVGLTPRRHRSGEIDYDGGISKSGDPMLRTMLYEAAQVLLTQSRHWSWLKAWGMKVAQRRGMRRAIVAVARRLAVVLHRM